MLSALFEWLIFRTRRRGSFRPFLLWIGHIVPPFDYIGQAVRLIRAAVTLGYFPAISFSTSAAVEGSAPLSLISLPSEST